MIPRSILLLCFALLAACGDTPSPGAADAGAGATPEPSAAEALSIEAIASDDDEAPWWSDLPRAGWADFERLDLPEDQGWFEVYVVAEGTWAIYEPGQWEEVISWLIEGEEQALLFDTGLGIGNIGSLAAALTDRPIIVLNSHTHSDHTGGNHQFAEILGTDTAYAQARSAGGTNEEAVASFFTPGAVWMDTPEGFELSGFRTRPWTVTRTVVDGEMIDLGGRRLEVLMTPGHAPDGLTLFDAQARMLFVGDTFYPAPLYAHLEGGDFDAYLESARELAKLADAVDLIASGHNEPVWGGAVLVELRRAFEGIAADRLDFERSEGTRIYTFETFKVIVAEGDYSP